MHRHTTGIKDTLYEFSVATSVVAICVCSSHGTCKSYSFIPRQAVLRSGFNDQPHQALTSSFLFCESNEWAEIKCIRLWPLCPLVATLEQVWDLKTGVFMWFCDGGDTAPLGYHGPWNKVRWQSGAISKEDEILPCCWMERSNEYFGSHCFSYRIYTFLWPMAARSNVADEIANWSLYQKHEFRSLHCIHTADGTTRDIQLKGTSRNPSPRHWTVAFIQTHCPSAPRRLCRAEAVGMPWGAGAGGHRPLPLTSRHVGAWGQLPRRKEGTPGLAAFMTFFLFSPFTRCFKA